MKNLIITIITFCLLYLLSTSCEDMFGDYLDKPPGVDITEDTIFAREREAEMFLNGLYRYCITAYHCMWDNVDRRKDALVATCTDEADQLATWYWNKMWNQGRMHPGWISDKRWDVRWDALRSVNIFLERIDEVPTSQTYIDQAKGQALYMRASLYLEMLKRYGGVPIVDKRLNADDILDIPRSTLDETVEFMVADCDAAAALLPDTWPLDQDGRISKGACLALKSTILLYAASPRFNTGAPVLDLPGHNDLICYGNYDVSRWQRAADAAKAVIDWAPSGGVELVTDQGVDNNYRYVWEQPHNSEVILGNYGWGRPFDVFDFPWGSICNFYSPESATTVPLNHVRKYEKLDGTPQVWNPTGDNLNQMYAELDPRFHQTIAYNGSYFNKDFPVIWLYEGSGPEGDPPLFNCWGGHWLHKWYPYDLNMNNAVIPWNSVHRLAEFYLAHAEALNEAQGPVAEAYNAVNVIRARSGMPDFPPGLTQDEFRQKLRNERSVEMAYENRRLWDILRWLIAEDEDEGWAVMKGDMIGIKITINDPPDPFTSDFSWETYPFESRVFNKNMYLEPFPEDEVNKGYIIQNPGW